MRPAGRPSFTPPMLADFDSWQRLIGQGFGPGKVPLKFLVLGSRAPGVFCFGGDLELFEQLIRTKDRAALANYGYRCVEILHLRGDRHDVVDSYGRQARMRHPACDPVSAAEAVHVVSHLHDRAYTGGT